MILRYLNRSHRPREIAPRRHPIPQLVEVVHLVGREIVDAHSVHARRSTVRSDLLPRLENETLPNFKRLQLLLLRSICRFLPRRVGLQTTVNCPAPSLRPHYRALTATTGRSAPVPRIGTLALAVFAACGSPSRGQKPWPSLSGRQILLFHASACDELTPPIHRAPPGPHTASSPTEGPPRRAFVPRPPTDPSFDAIVISFRCVSSGSHMFVFSSHTRPATARRQPQRSPPRLLTDAACGGLESPPVRRPRRTYLHHWHSTDRADDLLHHHHFPSGHTWVPIIRSWALTRGYTLHPGTSCVASFTGSSRCWHGWRCVAGARRTSSTNTEAPPDQPRQGFGHPHGWVDRIFSDRRQQVTRTAFKTPSAPRPAAAASRRRCRRSRWRRCERRPTRGL